MRLVLGGGLALIALVVLSAVLVGELWLRGWDRGDDGSWWK